MILLLLLFFNLVKYLWQVYSSLLAIYLHSFLKCSLATFSPCCTVSNHKENGALFGFLPLMCRLSLLLSWICGKILCFMYSCVTRCLQIFILMLSSMLIPGNVLASRHRSHGFYPARLIFPARKSSLGWILKRWSRNCDFQAH